MRHLPRNPLARRKRTAEHEAAMAYLAAAAERDEAEGTPETLVEVRRAVNAARDAGVGWTRIGMTLGIASGNAYQRYRPRPSGDSAESDGDATRCGGT